MEHDNHAFAKSIPIPVTVLTSFLGAGKTTLLSPRLRNQFEYEKLENGVELAAAFWNPRGAWLLQPGLAPAVRRELKKKIADKLKAN